MENAILVGPAIWPGKALTIQPGDLSRFAAHGFGLAAPVVMFPWDDLGDAVSRGTYYASDRPRTGNPFADAPKTKSSGGTIYFGDDVARADLETTLTVMGASLGEREYAVFDDEAPDPTIERFLVQRRIVPARALKIVFAITSEDLAKGPHVQPREMREAIFGFLDAQRLRWGTGTSFELKGTLGGDGDWAEESLAFGLMVENAEHGILRIWSRPWLITK